MLGWSFVPRERRSTTVSGEDSRRSEKTLPIFDKNCPSCYCARFATACTASVAQVLAGGQTSDAGVRNEVLMGTLLPDWPVSLDAHTKLWWMIRCSQSAQTEVLHRWALLSVSWGVGHSMTQVTNVREVASGVHSSVCVMWADLRGVDANVLKCTQQAQNT